MNPKDEELLAKEGVKKISESPSGRQYLAKLQKKYELDMLQPSDPRFEKVYGKKIEHLNKLKEKNEIIARDKWEEVKVKKQPKTDFTITMTTEPISLGGCPKCGSKKFKRTERTIENSSYKVYLTETCSNCGLWHHALR